ncbi:hypothetical protein HacjB3_18818 (plasmid) [Halalkalicoccus jeotgali B3]|uniref:Uncharacterized protein n=1 Tax=Halalkalicoccus jeotgali (strain DSM 18796 / CECT 7217 / JCM 14584 / KCTC 4019 / B3) TaxID=795797 RepID=D8JCJ6_HALJB|nr:hypothetical protein HacjB3_18818 [Halalkalicoccus jeotgali B3]
MEEILLRDLILEIASVTTTENQSKTDGWRSYSEGYAVVRNLEFYERPRV